jgi:type IV secretion system protein VirB10
MNLPPLGSLETFRHALRTHREPADTAGAAGSEMALSGLASASIGPGDGSPASSDIVPVPLAPTKPAGTPVAVTGSRGGGRRVSAEERRLGGRVFASGCGTCGAAGSGASMGSAAAESASTQLASAGHAPAQPVPSAGPAAPQVLQLEWLMPKGWVLECTLETAIDSTLPGLTTCVMPVDVLGADGRRVLLPRGTQLVGETRGSVRQGQARIAVLWSEARTPAGAIVNLGSAGTDALGRAGLPAEVDRQFGERFGAAILLSAIDGAIAAGVASQQHSGNSVTISPNASESAMTEALKETQAVAPRLVKAQGDRIAVLVARDIDFRTVLGTRFPIAPSDVREAAKSQGD